MKQTIHGRVPSKTEWTDIPGYDGKYQLDRNGDVRAFYEWKGSSICPHYKKRRMDGNSIILSKNNVRKKYSRDLLVDITFGQERVPSLDGEKWLNVKGFEDFYQISNLGRVLSKRSFIERVNGVIQFSKELVMIPFVINSGYERVVLRRGDKQEMWLVHRLVATHFINNPNNYGYINHIDEDKLNNHASNLEWCTLEYNANYGTVQERRVKSRRRNNGGKY